jgi:hypothetical protein
MNAYPAATSNRGGVAVCAAAEATDIMTARRIKELERIVFLEARVNDHW